MLLQLYSAAVLLLDILVLVVRCMLSIVQATFQLIVPPKEKSVAGETVLVSSRPGLLENCYKPDELLTRPVN